MRKGLVVSTFIFCLLFAGIALAAADRVRSKSPEGVKAPTGTARYIVLLDEPTLLDEVRAIQQRGGAFPQDRAGRPDLRSDMARGQLQTIDARFEDFEARFEVEFGRALDPVHRYRVALNGFSASLDAEEARALAAMDGVQSVQLDTAVKLESFAGPVWLGADKVWFGEGFLTDNRGEGVVLGIIDSGINWDHPSFDDPGDGLPPAATSQHDHENPYSGYLGLCSDEEVACNDKLVGVYDFVEDDPNTDVVEEFNNGRDNGAHGAHTAGTAGGNPVPVSFSGGNQETLSGVAPNANIVSYRVCYAGDPDDSEDDACQGSAILKGIDQAIADGVDVINYSIGGDAIDPWQAAQSRAFLEAVEAGIFVATSAGNSGRLGAGTVGRPANAPWITAVGSATHDKLFAGRLNTTMGGATSPPGVLTGVTLTADSLGETPIVYAGDFGNALCGTGDPELQPDCDSNTGASNPFPPGTFNGEIVVCDRGTYGRIEKGKNLLLAGAGGYVLANTDQTGGESVVEDQHCLPSTHLRASDGNVLRDWLAGGDNHMASLSGSRLSSVPAFADRVSDFSSRGPTPAPAQDILKPNLIAPGDLIFAAGTEGSQIIGLGGTSMASPHVADAAALLLAYDPNLTPMQVASILELSATDEIAKDENFEPVDHFWTGAGRPRLADAANLGVFLDETGQNFRNANPNFGGEPKTLNLASLTDASCQGSCSFSRQIGAFEGGRTWTVSTSGFPEGVQVSLNTESLSIPANGTAELRVDIDWTGVPELGNQWIFGKVHIDNPSYPTATMPVSIYASLGELPEEWVVNTNLSAGNQDFTLSGLAAMDQATFVSGGLKEADRVTVVTSEDPTNDDPYDGDEGAVTLLFNVPSDALWFRAETLASDPTDVDLFVGFDANGNGRAESGEEVCSSTTPTDLEFCDIFGPTGGNWWVVVQNWDDGSAASPGPSQNINVETVVVSASDSQLTATGPGITENFEPFPVRLSWSDLSATGGTRYGAVGISSAANRGFDVGIIPVRVERLGVSVPRAMALFEGQDRAFALRARTRHEKLFIDVPPGVSRMEVRVAGASTAENGDLGLELFRVPYSSAFGDAPEVALPAGATPVMSASGSGGQGPSAVMSGGVEPGRWHVAVRNDGLQHASVRVRVDFETDGSAVDVFGGLWEPTSRRGISQGFEYTPAGGNRAFLWYTYDRDGSPTWYLAAGTATEGNRWQATLFRFTNDGETQRETPVGEIAVSMLDDSDAVFTWNLFGDVGSDRVVPLSRSCPIGESASFTGVWFRGSDGLGGASVLANLQTQGHVHYLYDGTGRPRWLLAAGEWNQDDLPMLQFSGFCPNCTGTVESSEVGLLTVDYADNATATWTLDYGFQAPARGSVLRTDDVVRLTDELACER